MNSREILIQSRRPPSAPPGVRSPRTVLGGPLPPLGALRSRFIIAALVVATLAGCDYFLYTSVKDILATPLKYEGQEVKIKGTVTEAVQLPLLGTRAYTLQDGDARIVVIVKQGTLPAVKDTVKVRGTVKSTMITNGKAVGQRLEEAQRLK